MRSRNCVRWLYRLPKNYSYESGLSLPKDCIFQDRDGTVRLIVEREGRITVTKGYAWNGCSPKLLVFDLLFGTPTTPRSSTTRCTSSCPKGCR